MTWFHRARATGVVASLLLFALKVEAQPPPPGEFLQRVSALPMPELGEAPARAIEPAWAAKINPRLKRLVQIAAGREERSLAGDETGVVVDVSTLAEAPLVVRTIRAQGGAVEAQFENVIWARAGAVLVGVLAKLPAVASIRLQPVDRSEAGPGSSGGPDSDGIRAARLELMHARGYSGKGVRVGILDLGFGGYARLMAAGKVRVPVARQGFPAGYGVENGIVHGSACAEIVTAVAPDANLYLASFDGQQGHLVEAAQWLLNQGVQIISYSAGNAEAPNDGTDAISRFVDYTTRRFGVLWVVAAGNHARKHWMGAGDFNRQGLLEIAPGQPGIEVTALGDRLRIIVRWDDWGPDPRTPSAKEDIDAYLLAVKGDGTALRVVHQSTDSQNGGASLPLEVIDVNEAGLAGQQFLLVLKAKHVTRRLAVHVFLESEGRLYPDVPAGSILNPASARLAMAVGGIDVLSGELAGYSSQGPTDDHRIKPEVSAPTNTISWTYAASSGRFAGTSASCPHVAGFAALLKDMNPRLTSAELRMAVMRSVAPRGAAPPNPLYGYGEIDGGAAPAVQPGLVEKGDEGVAAELSRIRIPERFGGFISAESIDALRGRMVEAYDGLAVRVVTGRDLYRIGDAIRIGIYATGDCDCLLLARDARGRYSSLAEQPLRVEAGTVRFVPDAEDETLEITGPPGMDELVLVCADRAGGKLTSDRIASASQAYLVVDKVAQ